MIGKKMRSKAVFILLVTLIFTLLIHGLVMAKEPQFRIDIDSLNLESGVSANLTLSMINVQDAKVKEIKGIDNFDLISSSQSLSTQIINGDVTYQKDINYIIMPRDSGKFNLQGIVEYNGKTYVTNELVINVSQSESTQEDQDGEAEDLFIKTLISDEEIYFGQKVVLTYELYSRYNIENFGVLDDINIDGFLINSIPQNKLKSNYVYINGNKYVKYEAKQMYFSPIKTGTFTIPEYTFQVNVSTGGFFSNAKPFYIKTEPKELTVKSLPIANKPDNFSGIVGSLVLDTQYSSQEVNYGDPLTLSVTASGNCNLEGLRKIINSKIPGFSVYETEKNIEESVENNKYKVKKEFEIILVPEKNGDINIEPIFISYFDTNSEEYKKAEISGANINVKGDMPAKQAEVQGVNPILQTIKIDQVNYKAINEGYISLSFKKESLFIALIVFMILLICAASIYVVNSYRKKQDKTLKDIYNKLKKADNQNDIYNLFNSMIKHCFSFSLKSSSRDMITERLKNYGIADQVLQIVDYFENEKHSDISGIDELKHKIKEFYQKTNS